jgi:hypothetical protein
MTTAIPPSISSGRSRRLRSRLRRAGTVVGHDRLAEFIDAVGDHFRHLGALPVDLTQGEMGRQTQMQAPDAAVARVRPPFHHPAGFQAVDETGDGDRLDLQKLRQLLLRDARLTLQPDQDGPLRAGHAVRAGTFVGIDPQQPCDVVQQEQQIVFEVRQCALFPQEWHIISDVIMNVPYLIPCAPRVSAIAHNAWFGPRVCGALGERRS